MTRLEKQVRLSYMYCTVHIFYCYFYIFIHFLSMDFLFYFGGWKSVNVSLFHNVYYYIISADDGYPHLSPTLSTPYSTAPFGDHVMEYG